jgi:hypothetical protein
MYVDKLSIQSLDNNHRFPYSSHIQFRQNPGNFQGLNIYELVFSLTPLGLVLLWAISLVIFQKIRSNLDNKVVFKINTLEKVPCKNCQFFCNNHYLKCAVKPDIVLTEAAMQCWEYSPKKPKFRIKNPFG